ncbi:MAG: heat-inducible transcriptional repressor HrcA [Pseudomonadota bacterium]
MLVDLDQRARHLLRTLIGAYIRDGEPVGSRTLSRQSGLELSAATVRNVMADLEEAGFIRSPHTSAGRVPTDQGYRFFVDTMLMRKLDEGAEPAEIVELAAAAGSTVGTVQSASDLLSALTNFVGVVTVPARESFAFRHIDFVVLSETQLLAVLVFADGEVQNRLINLERRFDAAQLERAANYLNGEFAGLMLPEIQRRLVDMMATDRKELDALMQSAVDVAASAFSGGAGPDVVVRGQANLLQYRDLGDLDTLKSLFEAFQEKREILYLLQECVQADGVRLFIGEESGSAVLEHCSVVGAPYQVDDRVVGVVGVIGPTRMDYDQVISVVETTADALTAILNRRR